MKEATKARLEAQAEYQRAYRARLKEVRAPSRDDIARVALHRTITDAMGDASRLHRIREALVQTLVAQGFDEGRSRRRIDDLIDRYADGWTFQRKPHLAAGSGS